MPPGSSISAFNNPKTSGALGPSARSLGPPPDRVLTSGQVSMMGASVSLSDPRMTPGPDVSQQGQPPQTRTTALVGGALLLALLATIFRLIAETL